MSCKERRVTLMRERTLPRLCAARVGSRQLGVLQSQRSTARFQASDGGVLKERTTSSPGGPPSPSPSTIASTPSSSIHDRHLPTAVEQDHPETRALANRGNDGESRTVPHQGQGGVLAESAESTQPASDSRRSWSKVDVFRESGLLDLILCFGDGTKFEAFWDGDAAAREGHLSLMKAKQGSESPLVFSHTAMHHAAKSGRLDMVQWLHHYTDVPQTADAIDTAASEGHLEVRVTEVATVVVPLGSRSPPLQRPPPRFHPVLKLNTRSSARVIEPCHLTRWRCFWDTPPLELCEGLVCLAERPDHRMAST